jgi:regulator of sirC expression with transglutaminase-like and TPR domain
MSPHEVAVARFADVVAGDPWRVPVDEAALAMSAVLQPGLDVLHWQVELDELAAACPAPTRDVVVRHLFDTEHFDGDRATYADWRNSCLDRVVARRRGIPITLAVVVVEVARRLGVQLAGVGMPAHFLVGDPADPDWFVDAFDAGRILDRDGARALHARVTGGAPWSEAHLAPVPARAVVARMLNNLRAGCHPVRDAVRAAQVASMREVVPEFAAEVREAPRARAVLN